MSILIRFVSTAYLYEAALFDVCDGEPLNAEAVELCRRLEKGP